MIKTTVFSCLINGGTHSGAAGSGLMDAVAHREPVQEQTQCLTCSLWRGGHARAGDLPGVATHGGRLLEELASEEWSPWYRSILEQFLKNCCLWKAHVRSVQESSLCEGPCNGAGEESNHEGVVEIERSPNSPFPCTS